MINVLPVQATVGGPITISEVRTNADGSEVIYVEQNMGGRGCPPEIYKLDLASGAKSLLVSCNESEQNKVAYDAKFAETLAQFPVALNSVELLSLNTRAQVNVTREVKEDLANNVFARTDFKVDILRNDQKLRTLEYSGCKPDQAHEFKIYPLTNPEKLLIKSTSIGDCFEGGYSVDLIHLVNVPTSSNETATTTQTGGGFAIPSYVYQIIIVLLIGGIAWFAYGRKGNNVNNQI